LGVTLSVVSGDMIEGTITHRLLERMDRGVNGSLVTYEIPVDRIKSHGTTPRLPDATKRRPAPERQFALGLLRRRALEVRQDLRNALRLLDAGDGRVLPTTACSALDPYTEHPLQTSKPAHRRTP
jgi:hypothetical protein